MSIRANAITGGTTSRSSRLRVNNNNNNNYIIRLKKKKKSIQNDSKKREEPAFPREKEEARSRGGGAPMGRLAKVERLVTWDVTWSLLENSRHVRGGAIVAPSRNTLGQVTRIISGEARNTGQLD